MRFDPPLTPARLERRYQRFLADVRFESGETATVHCPNTGSMLGVCAPGSRIWLKHQPGPARKYAWTWELTELADGTRVGVNTGRCNGLVREAVENGVIPLLGGYSSLTPEFRYGDERSRIDFLLRHDGRPDCFLEVKNVSAAVDGQVALFPDSVSDRGSKHLREMSRMVAGGARAVLLFCVQRGDVGEVRPADRIDPTYGRTLREAIAAGVEAIAWRAAPQPDGIALTTEIPVVCP
ncbi:MAG: DNA/RNA nuclease SfsA [Burkholderiales bacterium]|nr:DNA/RNA nuclease SfsA [Burkholderiales bacterium]